MKDNTIVVTNKYFDDFRKKIQIDTLTVFETEYMDRKVILYNKTPNQANYQNLQNLQVLIIYCIFALW